MSSSALPPPGNLPSWSRVSTFDRSRYPRPFVRDRIPATDTAVDVRFLEKVSQSVQNRFVNQDKSIKFLQDQHSETLQKLHQELDVLKRENKDLKFKIIVTQSHATPPRSPDERCQSVPSDIKNILLQEKLKDLEQALTVSNLKNAELRKTVVYLESQMEKKSAEDDGDAPSNSSTPRKMFRRKYSVSNLSTPLPFNATLNPLQVRDAADGVSRNPTAEECEYIIQHLHKTNCQQLAELSRLRANRGSAASSRNVTPEPPSSKSLEAIPTGVKLPRIPSKPKTRKPIRSTSVSEFGEPLPIVVNSLSANQSDGRKRLTRTLNKPNADSHGSAGSK